MKTFLTTLFITVCAVASAQTQEYVCTPCGNDCDKAIFTKPGTCPSCHMKLIAKNTIEFEDLSPKDFCKRIADSPTGVLLLDVRTKGEFEGTAIRTTYGHFKNAININVEELDARMNELARYKDREILVYCSHSVRSPRAAMMLNQNGFKNVKNLQGGVSSLRVGNDECLKQTFVVH